MVIGSGSIQSDPADRRHLRGPGKAPSARRLSPGAQALHDHANGLNGAPGCRQCRETARRGLEIWQMCGAGYLLSLAALRARARRAVSA